MKVNRNIIFRNQKEMVSERDQVKISKQRFLNTCLMPVFGVLLGQSWEWPPPCSGGSGGGVGVCVWVFFLSSIQCPLLRAEFASLLSSREILKIFKVTEACAKIEFSTAQISE